eukprot:m.35617 g.35617  ORF g.35617 m.35617 type:complete len:142 (-) comp5728_c0_seq3:1969-2394(-)
MDDSRARDVFMVLADKTGGELDMNGLGSALRALGGNPTEDEIQERFYEADVDGSGMIDMGEFMAIVAKELAKPKITPDQVRAAFSRFDRDGTGFISVEEVKHMMRSFGEGLSDAEIDELIHVVDADHNGKVDAEEFVSLLA